MTNSEASSWKDALARHAASAGAYQETAGAISSESWPVPLGEGKWSAAQVTEHLNRTYQVVIEELSGGKGIRIRTPWLLRQVLRQTVLRSIYKKRQLPKGARAPSEVIPKDVEGTQSELIERFHHLATQFEQVAQSNAGEDGRKLTHHIFGEIDVLSGIDFVAIHIEHHHRQIAKP
jgi:hypothetical protein